MGVRIGVGCRTEAVCHGLTVIVCTVTGVDFSGRVTLELVARNTECGALVQPQKVGGSQDSAYRSDDHERPEQRLAEPKVWVVGRQNGRKFTPEASEARQTERGH